MWSKYSETFPIGVPQLDITGLPKKALKCLFILGKKKKVHEIGSCLKIVSKVFKLFFRN